MKILELFAGTKSISMVFENAGHDTYSIDWDTQHEGIDWYTDIGTVTAHDILDRFGRPDIIWCSPDCTTYLVAAISHHRKKDSSGELLPISEYAKFCDEVNKHVLDLIFELQPKYWFIENPVGALRKMPFIVNLPKYTVTYCQYGERRQKPTDIWTNHPNPNFKPPCKRGMPCHESAPRGARTGSQAITDKILKAKIPKKLCDHILRICEK